VLAQAPSACWGDYDNDGNLDLFVAATGLHYLYHNSGDGTFSRILSGSPATGIANSYGCTWVDFNGDGFLDLFVTVFDAAASSHCLLYRNNGDGTFTSVTDSVLVTDSGSSIGCAFGDYDNDGKPDLLVCGGRGGSGPLRLRQSRSSLHLNEFGGDLDADQRPKQLMVVGRLFGGRYQLGPVGSSYSVYTSTDSGVTWKQTDPTTNIQNLAPLTALASSADGSKLIVAARAGPIYTSADSGATWTQTTDASHDWGSLASVASSADIK
jgi:hypothetical protein